MVVDHEVISDAEKHEHGGIFDLAEAELAQNIGEQLRTTRKRRRLSLQSVQEISEQEFKASVVGAYERGDRAITVGRLVRLAQIYGVAPRNLLPSTPGDEPDIDLVAAERPAAPVIAVDVERLQRLGEALSPELRTVAQFAAAINASRRSHENGPLQLRAADTAVLARALGYEPEALVELVARTM